MTNENYRYIQNLLGGLTRDELDKLRSVIDSKIDPQTKNKGGRLIGKEHGYLEVKRFERTLKNGTKATYEYEYWRWWDGKALKSNYIGKIGTYAKSQRPAQPKTKA